MKKKKTAKPSKYLKTTNPDYEEWLASPQRREAFKDAITSFHQSFGVSNINAEIEMHFPGENEIPENGSWILVTSPPNTEIRVKKFSLWYAMPEIRKSGRDYPVKLAKILTPEGNLWLWSHEYRRVDILKYLEFEGQGFTLRLFGNVNSKHRDMVHYIMSRGLSKTNAYKLILSGISEEGFTQDICYFEPDDEVSELFSGSTVGMGLTAENHRRRQSGKKL